MVQLTKIGNSFNVPVEQWTCDTTSEMEALDVNWGTRVFCNADGKWYVKATNGWKPVSSGSGGGGDSLTWGDL